MKAAPAPHQAACAAVTFSAIMRVHSCGVGALLIRRDTTSVLAALSRALSSACFAAREKFRAAERAVVTRCLLPIHRYNVSRALLLPQKPCRVLAFRRRQGGPQMPAYLVATVAVHDPETYLKYTAQTPALIARHGGKFLTRGTPVITLEGMPFKDRMVIIEFPTQAHAEALFKDPEYDAAAFFRRQASVGQFVVQKGVAPAGVPDPRV